MMEPIGHYDPTHLAERIERPAYIARGWAGAMNPESITRESNDGSSRSEANTAEPYRTFGDPDEVWHDDFENAGNCHPGRLRRLWVSPLEISSQGGVALTDWCQGGGGVRALVFGTSSPKTVKKGQLSSRGNTHRSRTSRDCE